MNKIKVIVNPIFGDDEEYSGYVTSEGGIVKREFGKTPEDNNMDGRWVFRSSDGTMIDFDKYRHDLFERNDLTLTK